MVYYLLQVSLLALVLGTYVGADDPPPGAANDDLSPGSFLAGDDDKKNGFCPENFTLEGTSCYKLVKKVQLTWAEANAFCHALTVNWRRNAYLAEFHSADEAQKAIYMLLSDDKECSTWEQAEGDDDGGDDGKDDAGEDKPDDKPDGDDDEDKEKKDDKDKEEKPLPPGTEIWIGAHFMQNGFRWNENGKPLGHLLHRFWEQAQPEYNGGSAVTINCDSEYKFRTAMKDKEYPFICMTPYSTMW